MGARPLAAALLATLAAGCAHVTTSDPDATIWFDGRPVGRGGRIWALGPPHTARVVVVARDGRRAHALVARELTLDGFTGGLYTMGICFLLCWTYPDTYVALPEARPRAATWDDDGWDLLWMASPDASATPISTPTPTPTSLRRAASRP